MALRVVIPADPKEAHSILERLQPAIPYGLQYQAQIGRFDNPKEPTLALEFRRFGDYFWVYASFPELSNNHHPWGTSGFATKTEAGYSFLYEGWWSRRTLDK